MKRAFAAGVVAAAALSLAACSLDGHAISSPSGAAEMSDDVYPPSVDGPTSTTPASGDSTAFRLTGAPAGSTPKVVITVVEDMACPACKMFEERFGATLDDLSRSTDVAVDYHVISFLDRMSSDDYSSRAANASFCAWHASPGPTGKWRAFQRQMFDDQAPEGGAGLPDSELASIARTTLNTDITSCITSRQYSSAVKSATSSITDENWFQGTPTVRINDRDFTPSTPDALRAAVTAAAR
ncbi:MAG: thioredoxin domain-containing protein [Gordonia sp. (in: high G+C Gram-positive bacteria)]